uniref:Rho/Rac guanine nucleotide exchange factor 2 n=1 Tax=Gallus gallus TaxID=9031 RepID=A0A8V1AFZ9_CHICK
METGREAPLRAAGPDRHRCAAAMGDPPAGRGAVGGRGAAPGGPAGRGPMGRPTGRCVGQSKERMKEGKEKDARYTNGHLFTTITVSGMTMCFACNKSITAKEALICPTCNVTIHNRCKDTLPNCTKVKQKQQKAALLKNSTALQSVSLRNKGAPRERPNSAVYPSESFRQSLLGPRRGRPSLSLSKSVSTTNIAGTFNEESALGIRRILSQSTDSLNVRNRTVSVESLIEEELEADERDFAADSWSLAVDGAFLQLQRADVMRRQDVIYELMQTELHHVRTLKIMGGVLRRAMLEELQLQPGAVNAVFPCVDELSALHQRFLAQLLQRRRLSLVGGSSKNFVIQRLGDLLVSQFSGQSAEQLRKCYAEFCSKHSAALREYKELLARDKRLQAFVRRTARSPLLRRHGVPECILLVTQRITKYPVLIERILRHSRGMERLSLSRALLLVKDLISAINAEVREHELRMRLYDVYRRVDGRAKLQLGCATFGRDELLRRKLLHSGCVLWKPRRDVLLLLMTDVIVFLQEKDQKLSFPTMDKPAVISLHELIVRDVANQEKGLFLLSAAPPEMYELHAASRDERTLWMRLIQQAVSHWEAGGCDGGLRGGGWARG